MSYVFDNKFGLIFEEDRETVSLEEMRYSIKIESGRNCDTVDIVYQPDVEMYYVNDVCKSWKSLDEQIKFYKQLIKGLKKIDKEVKE